MKTYYHTDLVLNQALTKGTLMLDQPASIKSLITSSPTQRIELSSWQAIQTTGGPTQAEASTS